MIKTQVNLRGRKQVCRGNQSQSQSVMLRPSATTTISSKKYLTNVRLEFCSGVMTRENSIEQDRRKLKFYSSQSIIMRSKSQERRSGVRRQVQLEENKCARSSCVASDVQFSFRNCDHHCFSLKNIWLTNCMELAVELARSKSKLNIKRNTSRS